MSSPSSPPTAPAGVAKLQGRWPVRWRGGVMPLVWIVGIVTTSLLVAWLTDRLWLAVAAGIAGMVLAARAWVKMLASACDALERSERARAEVERALRQAQTMEALGRLTVGVAHDFNNHLTVISSNVEMVARRLEPGQERLLRHTEAALKGVQRAAALTGRMLSFARPPAPEPEAVDVDRLVRGLSDLLRRTLGDRIGLAVVPSEASWLTWADANQMENALLSLAVNARDQARDGATLTIAVSNVRLGADCAAIGPAVSPGDYIRITFSGAPGSDAPGDGAAGGASGDWLADDDFGNADLSMARAFVREAGGWMQRSERTAAFLRLFLPRHAPPSTRVSRRTEGETATILVVEDDEAVRGACVEMLRELGYAVLEAPGAMEAFRLIADHGGIDLLFIDLGLPGGVNGRALADAARNVDGGIRVLFTTGYAGVDAAERGGSALLRKPFNRAQLAGMVRDVLDASPSVALSPAVRG